MAKKLIINWILQTNSKYKVYIKYLFNFSHVNEGGVAAGLGALDSVYLVDTDRCC